MGAAADAIKADEFAKAAARDLPIMDRTFKACSELSMALLDKFSGRNVDGLVRDCNDDRSEGRQTCNDARNSTLNAAKSLGYAMPAEWTCGGRQGQAPSGSTEQAAPAKKADAADEDDAADACTQWVHAFQPDRVPTEQVERWKRTCAQQASSLDCGWARDMVHRSYPRTRPLACVHND